MTFDPKERFFNFIIHLQQEICACIEDVDGAEKFIEDVWQRPLGGGGWSRVLTNGEVFEKAGVNVSQVHGDLPDLLKGQVPAQSTSFYAAGISLVIHPKNPMIPTTHANFRYFQVTDSQGIILDQWFGGGMDLTPYYLFEEDARHFHKTLKTECDKHTRGFYEKFKLWCDDYFYNSHRKEYRGIGGIFFDHIKPDQELSGERLESYIYGIANAFLPAYLPIVKKRLALSYSSDNKVWQEIRRGRYVEFNLLHDRGTSFGLKTGGRIESIFMSLPPTVRWEYNHTPKEGSPEWETLEVLKKPKEWL